jgi:preprotein translocase SecE subunit
LAVATGGSDDSHEGEKHAGIYKFGQGYWVRVLTAVFAGIMVLGAAGWAANQLSAVDLPIATWELPVSGVKAADGTPSQAFPAKGERVDLFNSAEPPEQVGSAIVRNAVPNSTGGGILSVEKWTLAGDHAIIDSRQLKTTGGLLASIGRPEATPIFEKTYLEAGVAAILLLGGAIMIYYFVGMKRSSVEFLVAVDGEMKKVNWSTRKIIMDSTLVVISATFLIAGVLFVIDALLSGLFVKIGLLVK